MKQKIIRIILTLFLIGVMTTPLFFTEQSHATAITYTRLQKVTIKDTTGTNRTNVDILLSGIDVQYLIGAGYVNSNGMDVGLQDLATSTTQIFMVSSNQVVMVIPNLAAFQSNDYYLYYGLSPANTSYPIIVGNSGEVITSDANPLEPGNTFAFEISGIFDTSSGSNKYNVYKNGAFTVDSGSTTTGKVTATILQSTTAGSPQSQTSQNASVSLHSGGTVAVAERVSSFSGKITSVDVYLQSNGSPTGTVSLNIRNGASPFAILGTLGTMNAASVAGSFTYYTFNTTPVYVSSTNIYISVEYSGGDGSNSILAGYQNTDATAFGVFSQSSNPSVGWVDNASYDLTFQNLTWISANLALDATVATGAHIVKTYADATNFKIDVDSVNVASTPLNGASIVDNANNWEFFKNNSTPSVNYIKETVGATEVLKYSPAAMPVSSITKYTTGTATFTLGSNLIAGGGTTWVAGMVGGMICDNANGVYYTITSASGTSMTISENYAGVTDTSAAYTIYYGLTATIVNLDSGGLYGGTMTGGGNVGTTITYGSILSAASVVTMNPFAPTDTTVVLVGNLTGLGQYSSAGLSFQYGRDTGYGFTSSGATSTTPTVFNIPVANLAPSTVYHFRAVASFGSYVAYGVDLSFTTLAPSGSSTFLEVKNINAFSNYIADGDLLFTAEITDTYTGKYPGKSPTDYFQVQLIDLDDTTVLAAVPLQMWGTRPESIYLKPTFASTITQGASYKIKVIGLGTLSTAFNEASIDATGWKGTDLTNLDKWALAVASDMGFVDSGNKNAYIQSVPSSQGLVINDSGSGYFILGIPGISQQRPKLLATIVGSIPFVAGTANNTFDTYNTVTGGQEANTTAAWQAGVGTKIASDFSIFGNLFGMSDGRDLMGYVFMAIIIGIIIIGAGFGAKPLGCVLLSTPFLLWGNYLRCVPIQFTIAVAIIFGYLFVRQFFFKTT